MKTNLLTLLLLFVYVPVRGQLPGEVISLGLPYLDENKIYQDLFIENSNIKIIAITVTCFDVTNGQDSTRVYFIKPGEHKTKKREVFYSNLQLSTKEEGSTFNPLYRKIILNNYGLPAGDYCTYLTLQLEDTIIKKAFIHHVDSLLSANSAAHKEFENTYNPQPGKSFLGVSLSSSKASSGFSNPRSTIKKFSRKIDKTFNSKGYTVSYREMAAKTFADVHYQGRYVGYYEVSMNEPIAEKIKKRKAQLADNITAGVNNKPENNKPVFSQMRELQGESKMKEVVGNISVTGNMASGQEEYSQNENKYYEIAGQVEMPVMNIPVLLEGYYTSQDKGRVAKASYFRLHYDSEQVKAELLKLISGYNRKYDEAVSRGKGLESVYGTYLNKLQTDKSKLMADITAETSITDIGKFKADTAGLLKEITADYEKKLTDRATKAGDSIGDNNKVAAGAMAKKDAAMQRYNKAMDKYRQVEELEKKIQHYQTLLEQYRNNNYFDSVMAYDKLKDINSGSVEEKSYKQLSKSAGNLLPEGESKTFIAGLTSLDAGIFSRQISAYTLNGQTIKGVDAGYDIGFCETGFTYGRIEYAGRDGQLDKYSGYSARASFKPAKKQKTSLIYYGYMPSKKMLNENSFFEKVDVHMPTFKTPIHILSAVHSGEITNHVNMEGEVATSFREKQEFQKKDVKVADKMAYRIDMEGEIPKTTLDLKGGYEHIGKQFENNTLPLNLSGTDRYSAGAKGQFFDFLTVGVEYNYLVQQNFASRSANSKWGFDVKAASKRYPSVSLSYKPFTTFRSFSDTFNMPQRPILGEVWLGKLSYQVKTKVCTLRFTAIYNRNTALVDTMESNSNLVQFNAIYTKERINLMLNAGQTQVKANNISPVHGKTNFLTVAAGYTINPQWNVSGGQDIGMIKTGLSRYAANIGCGYRFKNAPLALRMGFRYNTYKMNEAQPWKNIYSGLLDINWQFRFKMREKLQ